MNLKCLYNTIAMVVRASIISLILLFTFCESSNAQNGETLFKTKCAICHKTNSDRFIGPGLAGIQDRRSKEWFNEFVTSSQALIKSGDEDAIKIFEEYSKIVMPDQILSDSELDDIYNYIVEESGGTVALEEEKIPEPVETLATTEPLSEQGVHGQELFSGTKRLENGGPSCMSCHHVDYGDMTAGGDYAAELTDVYERLGGGISAMISSLPFPEMKSSYQNHKITEDETALLVTFFKEVNARRSSVSSMSFRNNLLLYGILGTGIVMGIIPFFWRKRKIESVNHGIYERQIASSN